MNIYAAAADIMCRGRVSALPEQSGKEIALRVLVGMVLIMILVWLAAVIAGKLGSKLHLGGWFAQTDEPANDAESTDQSKAEENENNDNYDIGGNING